jgi:hypothetical protein
MNDIELYNLELIKHEMKRLKGLVAFIEYMIEELMANDSIDEQSNNENLDSSDNIDKI